MVKLILKVTKINNNKYLLLNKDNLLKLKESLKLNIQSGDFLEAEIIKFSDIPDKVEEYLCRHCNLLFVQEEDVPYCPSCDRSDGLSTFSQEITTIKTETETIYNKSKKEDIT